MSYPAGKALPVAKVMKFLKTPLEAHPEEGAAITVAVQSGEFRAKVGNNKDYFPDYRKISRISAEDKIVYLTEWLPSTSWRMWQKAAKNKPETVRAFRFPTIFGRGRGSLERMGILSLGVRGSQSPLLGLSMLPWVIADAHHLLFCVGSQATAALNTRSTPFYTHFGTALASQKARGRSGTLVSVGV